MDTIVCYNGQDIPYNISISEYSCDVYRQCECPVIQGDPDIAGLGVSAAR